MNAATFETFVKFLVDDEGRGELDYFRNGDKGFEIVETRDTIQDFKKSLVTCRDHRTEKSEGLTIHVFEKCQLRKGDERATLYVADCGDSRLAYRY